MKDLSNQELIAELERRLAKIYSSQPDGELLALESEMRQLRSRLQEAENSKSQFLSNVRNEINNPLSAIIGLAERVGSTTAEEKIRQMSALIEKEAIHLDFQMRNIIIAAEIEAGELRASYTKVDVAAVVKEQLVNLRHKISDRSIQVDLQMPVKLFFFTDGQLFQNICLNIISNAITYSGNNNRIIINVEQREKHLEFSVTDFGNGIEPSSQSEIFQRFRQGEGGITKKYCGHGLGLCIVKELTSHLNGAIEFYSRPGKGTTVKVILPEMDSDYQARDSVSFGNELLFNETEL